MPPRGALVRRMDEGAAAGLAGQVGHKQGSQRRSGAKATRPHGRRRDARLAWRGPVHHSYAGPYRAVTILAEAANSKLTMSEFSTTLDCVVFVVRYKK